VQSHSLYVEKYIPGLLYFLPLLFMRVTVIVQFVANDLQTIINEHDDYDDARMYRVSVVVNVLCTYSSKSGEFLQF